MKAKRWKKPETPTLDQEGEPVKAPTVALGRMPCWLRTNLQRSKHPLYSEMLWGARVFSWMDHTGTSSNAKNERIWVCEPYHLYDSDMWEILGFADAIRARVAIRPIADWNPCHCIRIEFSQK
jgi:hypothetical protein